MHDWFLCRCLRTTDYKLTLYLWPRLWSLKQWQLSFPLSLCGLTDDACLTNSAFINLFHQRRLGEQPGWLCHTGLQLRTLESPTSRQRQHWFEPHCVFSGALSSINDVCPDLNYLGELGCPALIKPFFPVLLPESVGGRESCLKCMENQDFNWAFFSLKKLFHF